MSLAAGRLSRPAAARVLGEIWGRDETPDAAAARLGLARVGTPERLEAWAEEVLAEHPELAERYRRGRRQLLGFFVGRVMARSGGRADPRGARQALERRLDATPVRR